MKIIAKITIIGVKSTGHIVVGNIFLTVLYKGSIISAINLGLILNQNKVNHDKTTSNIIIYETISKNIMIVNSNCIFYFFILLNQFSAAFSCAFFLLDHIHFHISSSFK
jgi:hypothetical protein